MVVGMYIIRCCRVADNEISACVLHPIDGMSAAEGTAANRIVATNGAMATTAIRQMAVLVAKLSGLIKMQVVLNRTHCGSPNGSPMKLRQIRIGAVYSRFMSLSPANQRIRLLSQANRPAVRVLVTVTLTV